MEPHRCGIFLLGLKYFDCFVFSSDCGECFTCSFNPVVNVLLELLIQYVVCFGFSWEVLFCLWQPPSCCNLFAFCIAPFQVFLCFEGEWVGRITNCFFFFFNTVPFLENEYPCSYFFFFFCFAYCIQLQYWNTIVLQVQLQSSFSIHVFYLGPVYHSKLNYYLILIKYNP